MSSQEKIGGRWNNCLHGSNGYYAFNKVASKTMTSTHVRGQECIQHPLVRKLYSHHREEIIEAVEALMKCFVPAQHEVELLHVLSHADEDESYAPLWAIVILGVEGTSVAVPFLYGILDLDDDLYNEAAQEALKKLALRYSDIVGEIGMFFVEDHFHREPASARLFGYGPLSLLLDQPLVKAFFLMALEQDDMWKETMLYDLASTRDARLLEIVKRHIALAEIRNEDTRELKEVYCLLDSEPAHMEAFAEFQRYEDQFESRDWKKRLEHVLSEVSDHPDEATEPELQNENQVAPLDDLQLKESMKRLLKIRDQYLISDFHMETYLEVRPRSEDEERFHEMLVLLGMDELWSVEKVQLLMNSQQDPDRALNLLWDEVSFATPRGKELFAVHFFDLWYHTPRTEFQGVTPAEMEDHSATSKQVKIGRNDPCTCGSGKKFKKCHGA